MKNPNGYGTVVKLKGNRRRPYVVRKTTGWNDKGHPIFLTIGYYATREEGMMALAEYNRNPWDINKNKTTFTELYEIWTEKKAFKLGESSQKTLKSAYTNCESLYEMPYKDIKSYHMQDVIDNCGKSYATQGMIKNLFYHLDRFALEIDLINKSYSSLVTRDPTPETSKVPFSEEEVKTVWEYQHIPDVDTILFFLYTGFRISEFLNIKATDVDLEQGIIKGGIKTKAGKNRIVPIHSKILHIVKSRLDENHEYLFTIDGKQIRIDNYYYAIWNKLMKMLNMSHTPHECRHTFRTRLDNVNANKRCIDLIMGHKSSDVGERIYTHKTIQDLKNAIELILD